MSSFRPHFPYDARGNLLSASRSGASDSQVESYTYNLLGNMTSYTKNGTTTSYTYDSSGLRTSKTHNGTTTRYYLSGGMVLNEGTVTDSGVTLSATNYIGNEIFGRKNASDTVTSFLLSNGHGDIEAVMQYSIRVGTYQYDAYGNITAMNEADGLNNPIRYAGEYFDEESGNYYLRARYYNPSLGRFMAEDPIMDGQNWYAYCGGNPVMFVDPSGMVIIASPDGVGRTTTYNAEAVLSQIIKITGDTGYYLDGYVIRWREGGEIRGGSEVGRALIKGLMDSDIYISIRLDNGSDPYNSGYRNDTIAIGSRTDSDELTAVLVHELTHAYTDAYGLDDNIIYNFADRNDPDKEKIKTYIRSQYQEATAITVEEQFRQDMRYASRGQVTTDLIGTNNYAQFPYALASDPNQVMPGLQGDPLCQRVNSAIAYNFGEGIVGRLLTLHK